MNLTALVRRRLELLRELEELDRQLAAAVDPAAAPRRARRPPLQPATEEERERGRRALRRAGIEVDR